MLRADASPRGEAATAAPRALDGGEPGGGGGLPVSGVRPGSARPQVHGNRPSQQVQRGDPSSLPLRSRFKLWRSIPFRLVMALSTLFLVCFALAACIFFELLRDKLTAEIDQSIATRFESVKAVYDTEGIEAVKRIAQQRDKLPMEYTMGFHLATPDGQRIAGNVPICITEPGWDNLRGRDLGLEDDGDYRFYTAALGDNLLSIGKSVHSLEELRGTAISSFGWTMFSSLFLAVFGACYISWRTHTRIQRIAGAMDRVAAGNLDARLPISSSCDDIDDLAWQINQALTRLQQMVESVRQVSNDIAHDLKTPLNRLYIHIEEAAELTRQGKQVDDELMDALAEAQDINATFEALLRIAQIEAGARRSQFSTVDLYTVLETAAEIYDPVAEEQGQTLTFDPGGLSGHPGGSASTVGGGTPLAAAPRLPLFGDRELLLQMLVNLIENAIRHCPEGATITLQAGESEDAVWFCIADDGPGVPEAERENVMRRLYRLESSRTTEGTGLGLSLVKAVAELHCGTVTMQDNRPGLQVCVAFRRDCPNRDQ